jgi:hypothetical protein
MKMDKVTGVEKAVKTYREWLGKEKRHNANIMLNTDTGEVWCDTFEHDNIYKDFKGMPVIDLSKSYCEIAIGESITSEKLLEHATTLATGLEKYSKPYDELTEEEKLEIKYIGGLSYRQYIMGLNRD